MSLVVLVNGWSTSYAPGFTRTVAIRGGPSARGWPRATRIWGDPQARSGSSWEATWQRPGTLLFEPLAESLHRGAIRSAADDVEVVPGALGDRAEVLGAVALVLRRGARLITTGPERSRPGVPG